ncbi:MAG: hypothetical protein ACYC77_09130 [Coriobacteriia bacterium]
MHVSRTIRAGLFAGLIVVMLLSAGCKAGSKVETSGETTIGGDEIEWTIDDPGAWPGGLVDAAKVFVAEVSAFDRMALNAPEVAEADDGTEWAVFTVGVTDQPEYENLVVVMKRAVGGEWVDVDAGTGLDRRLLPKDLFDSDFAQELLGPT